MIKSDFELTKELKFSVFRGHDMDERLMNELVVKTTTELSESLQQQEDALSSVSLQTAADRNCL